MKGPNPFVNFKRCFAGEMGFPLMSVDGQTQFHRTAGFPNGGRPQGLPLKNDDRAMRGQVFLRGVPWSRGHRPVFACWTCPVAN
jgi:hypothetical protein